VEVQRADERRSDWPHCAGNRDRPQSARVGELLPLTGNRSRSFKTTELLKEKVEAIRTSRMDARYAHLNRLLDLK
jgi:hypothetical protein